MGHHKVFATVQCAHLTPMHKLQALETPVRPGFGTEWLPTP